MCLGSRLVHGWEVTAEWALFPFQVSPGALGNVPYRSMTVLQEQGKLRVWAWGGHWCCRVAADKVSVTGTAHDSSLSFFAYLRMLVVFLHSLEGRSGSWRGSLDKAPGWRWKEKQSWRIKGRIFFELWALKKSYPMFLLRDNIAANNFAFYSLGEKGIFVPPFLLLLPGGAFFSTDTQID